jgi:hypothetical protein
MNKIKLFAGFLTAMVIVSASASFFLAHAQDGNNKGSEKNNTSIVTKLAAVFGNNDKLPALSVVLKNNGNVSVDGAKITAINGSAITATTVLGSATLTWTVNTDANTKLIRRSNASSSLHELAVGHTISFTGMLSSGSSLTVVAKQIKDWSVQKKDATFAGTVASMNAGARTFVLNTNTQGALTVMVSDSTKLVKGNSTTTSFADIQVGGKVEVSGVWDASANTITAAKVRISLPSVVRSIFAGIVKSVTVSSATTSNSLVLDAGNTDYTVNTASDTSVINRLWLRLPFTSINSGDHVRVYGSLNTTNTIDATVIRDTSLPH